MSHRTACAALLLLATTAVALGQTVPATFAVVEKADLDAGSIAVKAVVLEQRPVVKQVVVVINGKAETREVTENVPVARETLQTLQLKEVKGYTGDGKALDGKELRERVRPGAVIVFGDERLLRPPFGKFFSPQAVLLLSKAPAAPVPMQEK